MQIKKYVKTLEQAKGGYSRLEENYTEVARYIDSMIDDLRSVQQCGGNELSNKCAVINVMYSRGILVDCIGLYDSGRRLISNVSRKILSELVK